MADVVWPREVVEELNCIGFYISQSNPAAADAVVARLFSAGESLSAFPRRGRPTSNGLRELVTVPPYILTYTVDGDTVTILSVHHGARRPHDRSRS